MTARRECRTLLAVPTLALFACGGDTTPIADAVVEDSAGVRIIQYAGVPEVDPPFALAGEPTYRHGHVPDHYSFGLIGEGRLFPDGRAAVVDVANSEVVVLRPDGSRHDILARPGQGPGEIDYVTDMFVLGPDSLLMLDRNQSRFLLFANGSLAHTASIVDLRRASSLWPKGIDSAGRFLVSTGSYRSGFERRYMTEEHLEGLTPILRDRLRFANPGMSNERLEEITRECVARYEADLGNPISHFSPPFADAEGRVWLPTFIPGGPREGAPPYTVISTDGAWLGMVDGPPGLRILDVGWGRVLGIVTDEMGVESVVVHELVDSG